MNLSADCVRVEEDVIKRCTEYARAGNDPDRYGALAKFCRPYKKILSVGSAGQEPIIIGATHALDVSPLAEELLRSAGWKGEFFVGTCTSLPFADKSFECGVCSEVIEHLGTLLDVEVSLNELNRVCENWLVTTPCVPVPEPDHKLFFKPDQMRALADKMGAKLADHRIWWFMWKGGEDPFKSGVTLPVGAWHG